MSAVAELIQYQTEFQIHQSVKHTNVVDFTERKLQKLIKNSKNSKINTKLSVVLMSYKKCEIALAWRNGVPVYVTIDNHR